MFKLNIIVLFLPLDFSNTVFWGQDFFLCHLSWGRVDFYRVRLCGKIFSWSPDRLIFKLTGMFTALVVFFLPLSQWQCKYYHNKHLDLSINPPLWNPSMNLRRSATGNSNKSDIQSPPSCLWSTTTSRTLCPFVTSQTKMLCTFLASLIQAMHQNDLSLLDWTTTTTTTLFNVFKHEGPCYTIIFTCFILCMFKM